MKKMKNLAAMLTAGAMMIGMLAGCGGSSSTGTEAAAGSASGSDSAGGYKIALIQQHQTNAF